MKKKFNSKVVESDIVFDVIVIGGSYSGLSAAMALGRSLKKVLIIDAGNPCNKQTPHSHNFLTQDGKKPIEIFETAKDQVLKYETIQFKNGFVVNAIKEAFGFSITTDSHEIFRAKKLIFATGLKDNLPAISGFSECWGISILHCPYCHGYEVKFKNTAIISNGEMGFEFAKLITNWTKSITILTNGKSTFTKEQLLILQENNVKVIEKVISKINHLEGNIESIEFSDGSKMKIEVVYAKIDFEQHCKIPQELGCEINEQGLLKVDNFQKTTVSGVYACGDNSSMRFVSIAVSSGSMAGAIVNKELIFEAF
jgi:thioredoxin reductase